MYGLCLLGLQYEKSQSESESKRTVEPKGLRRLIALFEPLDGSLGFLSPLAGMETTSMNWKL